MSSPQARLRAALIASALLAAPLRAQTSPWLESDTLFVPGEHVPLSAFLSKGTGPETLTFQVRPELLTYVAGSIQILWRDPLGSLHYLQPTLAIPQGGVVELQTSVRGSFVVVSDLLRNHFLDASTACAQAGPANGGVSAIATHWSACANWEPGTVHPRGGQVPDANDSIGLLDWVGPSPRTEPEDVGLSLQADSPGPEETALHWKTQTLALLSDGTELTPEPDTDIADQLVPGYERYIAENYTEKGVTRLAAIWLSDQVRVDRGFPVLHRQRGAFASGLGLDQAVLEDVPVLQIVHAHIVQYDDGDPSNGAEQSLGTFLLPPDWSRDGTPNSFPLLFNGFYGLHANAFGARGPHFLRTLGRLYDTAGRQAVGVLWNGGGGSNTCQSMHASAYQNAKQLIDDAAALTDADPQRVVFSGGSRGGTTALAMAANPQFPNAGTSYQASYVLAGNPQSRPGQTMAQFANSSYFLAQDSIPSLTGYANAWKLEWEQSGTAKSGWQLALHTLTGYEDPGLADSMAGNDSALFRGMLKSKGVRVILRYGTHDFSRAMIQSAEYMDNLREDGVMLRSDISHRFGHTTSSVGTPDEEELLNRVFDQSLSLSQQTSHFRYANEDLSGDEPSVPFVPSKPVFVLEMAFTASSQVPFGSDANPQLSLFAAGEPGLEYRLHVDKGQGQGYQVEFTDILDPCGAANSISMTDEWACSGGLIPAPDSAESWDYYVSYGPAQPPGTSDPNAELEHVIRVQDGGTEYFGTTSALPGPGWLHFLDAEFKGAFVDSRTGGVGSDILN